MRACGRAARGLAALWRGIAWPARQVEKARERRRLRATLGAMSRRELADIGLARGDIERVACGLPPPSPRPPRRTRIPARFLEPKPWPPFARPPIEAT